MRGYVTFILVFFAVALLLLSLEALTNSDKTNLSQAIAFSRVSKIDLNAKDTITELAREGAKDGLNAYIAVKVAEAAEKCADLVTCSPPEFNERDAELAVNSAVYLKILKLENQSFANNVEVKFWCNNDVPSDLSILKDSVLNSNSALKCQTCSSLSNPICSAMVISKVDTTGKLPVLEYVQLTDSSRQGIIGISIFDKQYKAVSIGYIPIKYKIQG